MSANQNETIKVRNPETGRMINEWGQVFSELLNRWNYYGNGIFSYSFRISCSKQAYQTWKYEQDFASGIIDITTEISLSTNSLSESIKTVHASLRHVRLYKDGNTDYNTTSYEFIDSSHLHRLAYPKIEKELKWFISHPKLPFIDELFKQANHPKRMEYKFYVCEDMDYVFNNM